MEVSGKAPRVAVVTAAYNAAPYIEETLRSVHAQSLDDLELIVVDDGSSDGTPDVVKAVDEPRLRLITIPNSGVSTARNRGLEACTAPLVVFLDADDLLRPRALERMVETMRAHPDHVACFGHHAKIGEEGQAYGAAAPSTLKRLPERDTLRHLLRKNVINNGGAVCIRTEAARQVGGYDPTLRFAEDLEFWCRLAALGDFVPIEDVLLSYRVRPTGANNTLAGRPFHPNTEALDRMFQAPAVRARFDDRELRRLRHDAEANLHWSAARNELGARRFGRFAHYLFAGLLRYPDSLLKWRLIYLFLRGLPRVRQPRRPA